MWQDALWVKIMIVIEIYESTFFAVEAILSMCYWHVLHFYGLNSQLGKLQRGKHPAALHSTFPDQVV